MCHRPTREPAAKGGASSSHWDKEGHVKTGVSPEVLVIVNSITAVATILAAGLGAWAVARNTQRTLGHAGAQAQNDRAEVKQATLLAARREAFVSHLAALNGLGAAMHEYWVVLSEEEGARPEARASLARAISALGHAEAAAVLAAPDSLRECIDEATSVVQRGAMVMLREGVGDDFPDLLSRANEAVVTMEDEMRKCLESGS